MCSDLHPVGARLPALCLALSLALAGCAPELNWREIRPSAHLTLLFPCKPSIESRAVPLAGVKVQMKMHVCEVQGVTYAVAQAELADPSRSQMALEELRSSLTRRVKGAPAVSPWAPAGATPHAAAGRWRVTGPRQDGQRVKQDAAVFVYGTRVFQIVVMGPQRSVDSTDTFFDSIRLAA